MRRCAIGVGGIGMVVVAANLALGASIIDFPANGRYEQDFSSLQWVNDSSKKAADFGANYTADAPNTKGWVHATATGTPIPDYYFSTGNPSYTGWLFSGDPLSPTAARDLSVAMVVGSSSHYLALFLKNASSDTIDSPEVSFTTECWKVPGSTSQAGMFGYTVASFPNGLPATNIWNGLSLTYPTTAKFGFPANTSVGTERASDVTLTGLQWKPGQTLVLQWYYPTSFQGAGQVVGLDDIVVVPEPSLLMTLAGVTCAGLGLRQRRTSKLAS